MEYAPAETYEKVDPEKLLTLGARHAWIVDPIDRASKEVLKMPFFKWANRIRSPDEFKPVVTQLYYHSATFIVKNGLLV